MVTMDLTISHKTDGVLTVTTNGSTEEDEAAKEKKINTFNETDVKGNNNTFKTEQNTDRGSHCQDLEKNPEEKSASPSVKKAIDLRTHNRTYEGNGRTIFEDAEYFSKNYSYKLLPITLETVDEEIIHTEHNYCTLFMCSESEPDEDCSRTMDYGQLKEKNYKKRKAKIRRGDCERKSDDVYKIQDNNNVAYHKSPEEVDDACQNGSVVRKTEENERSQPSVEPLDLSSPLVKEQKTELCLKEHHNNKSSCINNNNNDNISININDNNNNNENSIRDSRQCDSDKENVKSKTGCIEVTITGPDEKENYQPCDMFLNDIARLVPKLIKKDCPRVEILDRTCDRYIDIRKNRLYYIISESTWRLFQTTNERVILTNDQSLVGQKADGVEINERPTYLIFDQFSLANSLSEYCKQNGGCFEYKSVEEGGAEKKKEDGEKNVNEGDSVIEMGIKERRGNVSENGKLEDEKISDVGLNKIDVFERIGNGDLRNLTVDMNVEKEKQTGEIQAGSVVSKKDKTERNGKGEMETSMNEHKFFDEIIIRNLRDGNGRDVIERKGNREQRNFEVDKNVKEEIRAGEVIIRNLNDANGKDVIKREGNEEIRNWDVYLNMEGKKLVTEVQLRDGVNGKEVTERKRNGELRNKEVEMNMAEEKCLSKLKLKNSNDEDVIETIENREPINLEGDIIFEKENLVIKEEIKNLYDLVEIQDKKKNFARREKLRMKTEEKPLIAEIKSFHCFTERQIEEMHEIKEEVVEKSKNLNKQRESVLEMTNDSWRNDLENDSVLQKSINRVEKENLDYLRIWENELEKKMEGYHSEIDTEELLEIGGLRQNVNVTKLNKMAQVEVVSQEEEVLGAKISKWRENDVEEEKSRLIVELKNVGNLFEERKNENDAIEKHKLIMGMEEGESTNRQMKLYNSENMKKEKEGDIKFEQEKYENTEKETESFCTQKKRQVKCDVDKGKILMLTNAGNVEKESLKCAKVEENKILKKTVVWRNSFEVAKEKSVIPKVKENSVFHDVVKKWEQNKMMRHKEEPGTSDEIKLKILNGLREKQEKFGLKEENESWRRDLWDETKVSEEINRTVKSSPETEKETEEDERLRKIPQSAIETNQKLNTPKENFPDYNKQSKGMRRKTNAEITEIKKKDEKKFKVDENVESVEIRNMKKQVVGKFVPEESENDKYGVLEKVLSAEHPVEQPEREIRRNGNVSKVLIKNSLISIDKVTEGAGKDGIEGSKNKYAKEVNRPGPELHLEKVSTPEVASQFQDVGKVGGDLLEVKSGGFPKKKEAAVSLEEELEKEGESIKNEAKKKRQKRELKINKILRYEITQPKGKDDVKGVNRAEVKVQTLPHEEVMAKKVYKSEIHSEKSRKNDVSHWKMFLNTLKKEEKIVEVEDQNNKRRLSQKGVKPEVPTPEEVIRESKVSQKEEIAKETNFMENPFKKKEKIIEIEDKLENGHKSGSVISQTDVKLEETKNSTAENKIIDELKITEVMSKLGRLKVDQKNTKPQSSSHKEIIRISKVNQQKVNVEKIVENKVSQWKEFSKEIDFNRVQEEKKTKEFRHGLNNIVPVVINQSCLKNESEEEKILKTKFIKTESDAFEKQKELLKRTNQTKLEEKKEEKTKDARKFERKEIMVPFVLIHNSEEFNRRIKAEECKRIKENEGKKSKIMETEEDGSKKQNENILKDTERSRKRLEMNLRKRKLVKRSKMVAKKKKFRKKKVASENESGCDADVRRSERMMTKSGNEKGESSEFKTAVVKESSGRVGIRSKRKVEGESLTPDALTTGASQKSEKPKEGLKRGTKRKAGNEDLESKPEENQKKRRNSLDMLIMMSAEIGRESRLAKIKAEKAMSKEFDECGRKRGTRKMGKSKTKKKRKQVENKMVVGERRLRLRPEQLVKNKNKKTKVKSKIVSSKGRKR